MPEYIDVGSRVTRLSETPDGDLQIDMENYETLILSSDELDEWVRYRRSLDGPLRCERPLGAYVCRLPLGHAGLCKRERFPTP